MNPIRRPGADARRRRTIRSTALAGVATLSLLALAACGGSDDDNSSPSDDEGTPVKGGTLDISFFGDNGTFHCIDPFQTYWIEHRTIIRNFTDSLTDQDPKDGTVIPHLATSWEISPDGLTYTFTLRDDATFSDGTKLDAAAVKASADGWLATVASTPGVYGASYIANLTGATVIDPTTVEFAFSAPNSSFLQATATTNLAILAPSSWQVAPADRCLGTGLIGSGPFVLDHYTPDQETVIKKRPGYAWASELEENQGEAYLDEIDFHYVKEDSVRTGNLLSGATDIAWPRNPFSIQDLAQIEGAGKNIESRSLPGVSQTLFPNTAAGRPLADVAVRRALYKAIDLETLTSTTFGPDYPLVAGVFDNTTPYFKSQESKLGFDLDGAKAALDDAGWTAGSDGIRAKDGKKLTLVWPQAGFTGPGSELLQAQLKEAGIDLQLPIIQQSQLVGVLSGGEWDLFGSYLTRADPGALRSIVLPDYATIKALAQALATPDVSAELAALFDKATSTTDLEVAASTYGDLQDLVIDEGVTFPLFERVQFAGVDPKVHGFAFTGESFLRANSIWKSS